MTTGQSGKTGFGIGSLAPPEHVTEEQRQIIQGDHTALLKAIEDHLHRLSDKYAEQPVEQPNTFTLTGAAGQFSMRLDYTSQPHNSLIICVLAGTLNLWLGDYSGLAQTANPNAGQYAAVSNTQLIFPLKGRTYTVINPSTTVPLVGSLIPLAL